MADKQDRIRVQIEGKLYNIIGGAFQEMLAAVKQINGRRFDGNSKLWQLPGTTRQIQDQLASSGFQLEGGGPAATAAPGRAAQPAPAAAPARAGGDRIRISVQGRPMAVVGGDFQAMLAAVKNLPGRRFNGDNKIWEIPGEAAIIKQLVEAAGFQLEGAGDMFAGPAPEMETPNFGSVDDAPSFEEPDFLWDEADVPPYEPPDWWDDDNAPPPPPEPPDWWGDDEPSPASPAPAGRPARSQPQSRRTGGDQIRVRVGGIPFVVSGGGFQEMLAVIKQIPGRKFDGQDKIWDIPAGLEAARQLIEAAGFDLSRD